MVIMVDEIFDRSYQAGRQELHAGVDALVGKLGRAIGNAFEVLAKIQYDAPWTAKSKRARFN
jgi:hypothetical protein